MALIKKPRRNQQKNPLVSIVILFWLVFFVIIGLLFAINASSIVQNVQKVFNGERARNASGTEQDAAHVESVPQPSPPFAGGDGGLGSIRLSPGTAEPGNPAEAAQALPDGAVDLPPLPGTETDTTHVSAVSEADIPASQFRERKLYLASIDSTGLVFTIPVKRQIPVNNSPLMSTLNALLQGPTAAEKKQGLVSLIPEGAKVLGASIKGSTATINFNENFLFNSFGAEGYIGQLQQIIWTATEFPNINEVQIQIEGKKIMFLGETLRIDHPLGRDSL